MHSQVHIAISYLNGLPIQEDLEEFESKISNPKLSLIIAPRDPIPFACMEWYIPTAILAYISRPYFSSFLGEMGKDHYHVLKNALKNLGKKYIREKRFQISYVAKGKEKISFNNIYSSVFSIVSESPSGTKIKLLLHKDITEEEYSHAVELFFDLLNVFDSGVAAAGNMIFVGYNKSKKVLEFLDPLEKIKSSEAIRKKN